MSPADTVSDMNPAADASPSRALSPTRPFYWSVRRELWENRAVYLAPLAVAVLVLIGFLLGAGHLAQAVRGLLAAEAAARAAGPANLIAAKAALHANYALTIPYAVAAGAPIVTGIVVAIFYCLAALHGERRDRSVLFWKSLPVSDLTTVLSKLVIPLVVVPLVVFPIIVVTQLVMLGISAVVLSASGLGLGPVLDHTHFGVMWLTMPYSLVVLSLWYAPICGWLMLISAWARRMPILWALAPPFALALFEFLVFRTGYVWSLLHYRLQHGFAEAFTPGGQGQGEVTRLDQVDVLAFLSLPGLWAGLVFAAACFAACAWLRRRSDPI